MLTGIRYLISAILFIGFLWVAICNAWIIIRYYVRKESGSTIPFIGGICGVIAILIIPLQNLRGIWWIPLIIDWGSLPLIITYIISAIKPAKDK